MAEKPSVTLPGTVEKIIKPSEPGQLEKAQIEVEGADDMYRELRIENSLTAENGQKVKLKSGIDKDTAKTIQKGIKDLKLKVNASIQGEALRVSGSKKDDLQAVIAHLKANPPGIPLQFNNFR